MRSPVAALIDVAACVANCRRLREAAGGRELFPVVKADAYGHGLMRVAAAIADEVDGFCVFELPDALKMRRRGIAKPIVVLGGLGSRREAAAAAAAGVWPVLSTPRHLALIEDPRSFELLLVKAQTGMNRLGLAAAEVVDATLQLRRRGCPEVMLMHHFADADKSGGATGQRRRLAKLRQRAPLAFSESNSAALLATRSCGERFVRPGISLYGASPDEASASDHGLVPAMRLVSRVIAVQRLARGDSVGYGSRWKARRATTIAVVACGYADGYPRHAPDGTPVAIGGRLLGLAGRVSMEMLTVEVPDGEVAIGDRAQLWGEQVPVDTVARRAGTISYELLARLPAKVPRRKLAARG